MKNILPPKEWCQVNCFIKEIRGTYHSPVVSVYVPSGKVDDMIKTLEETERESAVEKVETAIIKELGNLKAFTGSVCIFGWKEEMVVVKNIFTSSIIPPVYVVDNEPFVEPLCDILEIMYDTLLVILDYKTAILRYYKGCDVIRQKKIKSYVRARHSKGGWSQKRFSRIRDMQISRHFDSIADELKNFDIKNIEVILVGGPGNAKKEFLRESRKDRADRTIMVEGLDLSSSDEEINTTIISQLDKFRKQVESRQLTKVEESIKKGLILTENQEICAALKTGAVDTILIASDYYVTTPEEKERILKMIEAAEVSAAEIEFITDKDILKKLHRYENVVALLRYSPF
ncbi:hypothetical protein E3V08_01295 [Candidatus Atribacteria bacterium MT.SAG.1]|nr:hypothetical protein E3V08_01295 [Candidatus Atribacteria bacterium MT.SAG.1]